MNVKTSRILKPSIYISFVLILIISSGCLGGKDSAQAVQTTVQAKSSDDTFLQALDIRDVPLKEIETQSPTTLEYLTTYGIVKVTKFRHPVTLTHGWKYEFATPVGCQAFTEQVVVSPETLIGIHGDVNGKVVMLGNLFAYRFTNDASCHYVTPLGNTVVILSGTDLSGTYGDSQIICKFISKDLGNPASFIDPTTLNTQIYPAPSKSKNQQSLKDASPYDLLAMGDYSAFFS